MSGLTSEQKQRIEENRQKALALRANRVQQETGRTVTSFTSRPCADGCNSKLSLGQSLQNTASKTTTAFRIPNDREICSRKPSTTLSSGSRKHPGSLANKCMPSQSLAVPFQNFSTENTHFSAKPKSSKGSELTVPKCYPAPSSSSVTKSSLRPTPANSISSSSSQCAAVKGKCVLLSRHRFCVDVEYHAALIVLFKSMATKQYDPKSRKWSFDLKDYTALVHKMQALDGVCVEPLPRAVQLVFRKHMRGQCTEQLAPEADLSSIDPSLVRTLMPFQRDGVNFGIHHEGRVLIADDMGLGKTLQAIAIASYYRQDWPMLIVVPSSVRFAWRDVNVTVTSKDSCVSGLVNIVSYDMMVRRVKELAGKGFQTVIMDESHALKSGKTARTQAAQALFKKAKRLLLLSGTPALSRPSELYTQIAAVDPKLFPKFSGFGVRYCDGKQMPWGWDFSGSSNLTELQLILEERILIRRLKKDVLSQLPSKNRQMVILDPGSVRLSRNIKASHKMVGKMRGQDRHSALLEYFHDTAAAKIPAVTEYIIDLLDAGKKLLLFAHHQEVLDAVEDAAEKKCQYIRIDGRTTAEQRNYFANKFQKQEDVQLAILSIMAANSGLNLTAATMVIFAELFWNPGVLVQAEDRAHRIGQLDSVNIQYLVASGTADDYIWPLVQKKLEVLGKAGLTNQEDFSAADTKRLKIYLRSEPDTVLDLQDPKQKDLLAYFEESFIEDDMPDRVSQQELRKEAASSAASDTEPPCASTNTPEKAARQKNMLQYFQMDQLGSSRQDTSANQSAEVTDDMTGINWLDAMDEVWEDEEPEAPWPKKPRMY